MPYVVYDNHIRDDAELSITLASRPERSDGLPSRSVRLAIQECTDNTLFKDALLKYFDGKPD
jgi:hypothetical protein